MLTIKKEPQGNLAIEAHSLEYRYPNTQAPALQVPTWEVTRGEQLFLQGHSGSGKSTLLQLLCGLRIGTGALCVAGCALNKLSSSKRDNFRARNIGVVFQQFNLIPYLSMLDNVVLAATLAGGAYAASAVKAKTLLESVGLPQRLWRQPAETLSIGQQQRVAIARALINSPQILLLDEPTSALDDGNQTLFMDLLLNHLKKHDTTTIFVSHDIRLARHFDRTVALSSLLQKPLASKDNAH